MVEIYSVVQDDLLQQTHFLQTQRPLDGAGHDDSDDLSKGT